VHFYLSVAGGRLAQVAAEEDLLQRTLDADDVLGRLRIALAEGLLDRNDLLASLAPAASGTGTIDPLVLSFGLSMESLFKSGLLPPEAPSDYPYLCDWLEGDLIERLARVGSSVIMPEASERSGETLSIRVAIVHADADRLELFEPGWWEVLEAKYYSEVYGAFLDATDTTSG
jgi:hypothetical protein